MRAWTTPLLFAALAAASQLRGDRTDSSEATTEDGAIDLRITDGNVEHVNFSEEDGAPTTAEDAEGRRSTVARRPFEALGKLTGKDYVLTLGALGLLWSQAITRPEMTDRAVGTAMLPPLAACELLRRAGARPGRLALALLLGGVSFELVAPALARHSELIVAGLMKAAESEPRVYDYGEQINKAIAIEFYYVATPLLEEVFKALGVWLVSPRGVDDYMYGAAVGAGFAARECYKYALGHVGSGPPLAMDGAQGLLAYRAFVPMAMHMACTAATALPRGRRDPSRRRLEVWRSTVAHAMNNYAAANFVSIGSIDRMALSAVITFALIQVFLQLVAFDVHR